MTHRLHTQLFAACALALALTAAASAQTIQARPGPEVLAGEALALTVDGLKPGATVRLRSSRMQRDFFGVRPYQAEALFQADAQGRIDLASQAPLSGDYAGADGRGMFWSMTPVKASAAASAPADEVLIQAFDTEQHLLTERRLRLRAVAADVVTRPVAEFAGAVYAVQPGKKRAAVIVLGGSEGGSSTARHSAPELASQGFAVLGLPYYSPGGYSATGPTPAELPSLPASFADIELSQLEKARDWLAAQPEVDASRIAVYGISKGAEFALAAASRMPWIKSVVAIVPSDVIWEGWGPDAPKPDTRSSFAWKGQPLAYVPYQDFDAEFAGMARGLDVLIRRPMDKGRTAHPERVDAARIEVEKIKAPVLLVGGLDDQVWDSGGMARAIEARRQLAGLTTVALVYEGAGHPLSGNGYAPTTQYNAGPMKMGGQPAATARAQADAWPKTMAFLRETLK